MEVHNLVAWPRRVAQLEPLQAAGSARVIGVTHYSPGAFGELRRAMEDRRIGAIQVPYNPHGHPTAQARRGPRLERDVESVILSSSGSWPTGSPSRRSFRHTPEQRRGLWR